jgi:hypothetical protein
MTSFKSKNQRETFISYLSLIFLLFVFLYIAYRQSATYLYDFSLVWKSAETLAQGDDPYSRAHYATFVTGFPEELKPDINSVDVKTYYPPTGLSIFLPFTFFSLEQAKILYAISSFFILIYVARSLFAFGLSTKALWLIIPWGLILNGLAWGSTSFFVLLAFTLSFNFLRSNQVFLAGFFLGFASLKPHFMLPVALLLMISTFREGRRLNLFYGITTAILLLTFPALYFREEVFVDYYNLLKQTPPTWMQSATLSNLAEYFLGVPLFRFGLSLATYILLIAIGLFATKDKLRSYIFTMQPFIFLFSPFGWGHDFIICIPAIVFIYEKMITLEKNAPIKWSLIFIVSSNILSLLLALSFWVPGWYYVFPLLFLGVASLLSTQLERRAGARRSRINLV